MARDMSEATRKFTTADNAKAIWQIASTALLFFPLAGLMFYFASGYYVLTLLLAVPAGALLTRFFALQHDCGHGSLFADRRWNEITGRMISVLTFTPFDYWRRSHAAHHASSGHLDRRGIGDIETWTVREYACASSSQRLRYRIMRHPLVALVIGPPVYFVILQRFAVTKRLGLVASLKSVIGHDVALLAFYAGLALLFGFGTMVAVCLPMLLVGAWIGGILFYVQHQFEETLWDGADEWDVKVAALKGSSHLVLHPVLNWLTCDIGIHHIHHLSSRIPNYRLRECLEALPPLQEIAPKLNLRQAVKTMHLALWDEGTRKMIPFKAFG